MEIIFRSGLYFASLYSLCFVASVLTSWLLPGARANLRLASVLTGAFVINAIIVQTIGLAGLLRADVYVGVCLAVATVVSLRCRERRPHRALWRLVGQVVEVWVWKMPAGLGFFLAACFMVLAYRCRLVEGVDSLTLHGPMVVRWIQEGAVTLLQGMNYPLCWEYQFVPNFLLLRSDALALVPRVLISLVLLLVVKELAVRIRLPGVVGTLLAWLLVLAPVVWGRVSEGSLKNDQAFAAGLLLCLLALDRLRTDTTGGLFLLQMGSFLVFGTKATGVFYGAAFLGLAVLLLLVGRRLSTRRLMNWLALTVLVQAFPLSVQASNLMTNGSPFYPVEVSIAGWQVFDGPTSLDETSVLESMSEAAMWKNAVNGGMQQVGLEFPPLGLLFCLASLIVVTRCAAALVTRRRLSHGQLVLLFLTVVTVGFWALYSATPWSAGRDAGALRYMYLKSGASFRYALAPIALTYVIGGWAALRVMRARRLTQVLSCLVVFLLFAKWTRVILTWNPSLGLVRGYKIYAIGSVILVLSLALWASARLVTWAHRKLGLTPAGVGLAAVSTLVLAAPAWVSLVESRRHVRWGATADAVSYGPVWKYIRRELPPTETIAVTSSYYSYFLFGERLGNRLVQVAHPDRRRIEVADEANYFYLANATIADRRFRYLTERRGWSGVAENAGSGGGILLERALSPPAEPASATTNRHPDKQTAPRGEVEGRP